MSNSNNDSVSYEVRFVITKGKTSAEVSKIMKTAFEAMECNCLEPMWISHEECLQFKEKQSKLFICDPFGDVAFQHLSSLKCRILGPLCILTCLQNDQSLPLRPYPVYSVTMRGITITCSNVDKTTRKEIEEKVQLMGGLYNKDLTQSVTHLVVNSVGSAKYHVANKIGLPIMLPEWVSDCWNNGQYQQLHARDSSYNLYRCPIFKGLCVTVSQLTNEERKNAQKAIEENGGTYSGQMRANATTHLVLLQPKGDKYKFGKTWKIKCVKLSWLYDSLEAGYAKNEMEYQLDGNFEPSLHSSTPEKNGVIAKSRQLGECSGISDISMIPYRESRIDETTNSDVTVVPVPSVMDFFNFCLLDELTNISNVGQFFDSCKILISGFTGTRMEKLQMIVSSGGGAQFCKLNEGVTHIVLGEQNDDILKYALQSSTRPHVVSYLWLLKCFKERKLVDEQPYIISSKCSEISSSKIHSDRQLHNSSTLQTCQADNADISNKFNIAINHTSELVNSNQVQPLEVVAEIAEPNVTSMTQNTLEERITNCEGNLLFGFTITIDGFGPKDTEIIEEMVKSEGGKMIAGSNADLRIVPLIGYSNVTVASNILTNCWLQMCIEQETLLPFDLNPLFKPLPVKAGSLILKDCVLSFSQYTGTERDCLSHLAEEMGAHCQEYFVRKASKTRKLLPNTHLVVATPEGNKYEAAKKWNIPAVTKDWLFASVYQGAKANEQRFLVDQNNPQMKDSACTSMQALNMTENITAVNNNKTNSSKTDAVIEQDDALPINIVDKNIKSIKLQASLIKSGSDATPSRFLNPDISFHPDYEVNSLLSMLDNSNSSGENKRKLSLPIQDLYALNISKALKNIGVETNTSDDPYHQEQANLDPGNTKESIKPLGNTVICISKKLVGKQSEFHDIITSLGGECQWNYSSSCTHFVCQGKSRASSRELRLAQNEGKKIVSPEWIYACRDASARVDEVLYPHTYNPRLSLHGEVSSRKIDNTDTVLSDKPNDVENTIVLPSKTHHLSDGDEVQMVEEQPEGKDIKRKEGTLTKELEDLLNVTKVKGEKYVSSPNSKLTADGVPTHSFENKFNAPQDTEKNFKGDGSSTSKVETVLVETQSVPIAWDDPTGRNERERLADHVNQFYLELNYAQNIGPPEKDVKNAEKLTDRGVEIVPVSDSHKECRTTDSVNDTHELEPEINIVRKFMFSGLSDNEKGYCSDVIKKLGGKVSTVKSFDGKATHLILGQPLKNEKFLGSVASGLWVLHKTYIEACEKAGHFVEELCHEWGGPMTYRLENTLPDKLSKVAMCPSRWRVKIQEQRKKTSKLRCGAFQGWKVLIIAEKQKQLTYSRILENGGAEIVPSLSAYPAGVTHAFIELKNKKELSKISLETLISSGIYCLKPEYLGFYLIEPVIPPEDKFIIPEALELMDRFVAEKKRKCSDDTANTTNKRTHLANR